MTSQQGDPVGVVADGALTISKAVEFAGVTRSELYRRMASGELQFLKIGKRRLIPKRSLVELLAKGLVPVA